MPTTEEVNVWAPVLIAADGLKKALCKLTEQLGPPPPQPKAKDDGTPPIRHVG